MVGAAELFGVALVLRAERRHFVTSVSAIVIAVTQPPPLDAQVGRSALDVVTYEDAINQLSSRFHAMHGVVTSRVTSVFAGYVTWTVCVFVGPGFVHAVVDGVTLERLVDTATICARELLRAASWLNCKDYSLCSPRMGRILYL